MRSLLLAQTAVHPDGSLQSAWAVDASDALPARLALGLFK